MAKTLKTFQKCIQQQRLLCSCYRTITNLPPVAGLLQPDVCVQTQKRHLWKKREYWKDDFLLWMYHEYRWNWQEWKAFINKKSRQEKRKMQEYNWKRVHQLNPDLAAAEFFMLLGGKVKFVNDENWYQKYEKGHLPVPRKQKDGHFTEGIDASGTHLMDNGLEYLFGLEHLQYLSLARCEFVDDWFIERILELCPTIEALDISGCKRITDNALELIHKFPNLKLLNVSDCPGIKCGHAIATYLEEFCPELSIIGLDTLSKFETLDALNDFEQQNSRYMNWGLIMNKRLHLNNEVDFDKVIQSGMAKMKLEMKQENESKAKESDDCAETDSKEGSSEHEDEPSSAMNTSR